MWGGKTGCPGGVGAAYVRPGHPPDRASAYPEPFTHPHAYPAPN